MSDCPFCRLVAAGDILGRSTHAAVLADAYPLAAGHVLVVPHRHVANVFQLDAGEYDDLWRLVRRTVHLHPLAARALNVGVNVGALAGQTVAHAHVHLIPRQLGDTPDPRGGVRWVLPERAVYWPPGEPGWGTMLRDIMAATEYDATAVAALLGVPAHAVGAAELPRLRCCWHCIQLLAVRGDAASIRAWWTTPHVALGGASPQAALDAGVPDADVVACAAR